MEAYHYDEDISENRFFLTLQQKEKELYEMAMFNRWMICVPCTSSLGKYSYDDEDFMNHILQASDEDECYRTLSNKKVTIQANSITCGEGFKEVKTVRILFEETFFNLADESYRILCLDMPLEGGSNDSSNSVPFTTLQTFDDCTDLLFGHGDTDKSQKQLTKLLDLFIKNYRSDIASLRHHIDATQTLFTKAVQIVMKDSYLKANARHNKAYMDKIKVAVETYVLHFVYKKVFKGICTYYAKQDASFNKVNRNLADLQFKELNIRPEFKRTIPKARTELGFLIRYSTPLGKLSCLKRVISTLTQSLTTDGTCNADQAMTSDDLLPILVFLVVKADIPNWLANLAYMTKFRFAASTTNDEFQFYLASMEAAIEYVRSGQLDKKWREKSRKFNMEMKTPQRQLSGSSSNQGIEKFFQLAMEGDHDQLLQMLAVNQMQAEDIKQNLCHPLCSCDNCEALKSKLRDDDAVVTVFSRDDRGFTALHVASLHGHANIVSSLIEKGSVVNATDYHGSTPLHLACQKGHLNIILLLLHFGADPNLAENDGNSPLHLASSHGHEESVQALLLNQKGVKIDVNAVNDWDDTPLHLAAKWGYVDIVEALLEHGASPQAQNRRKMTPLNCSHNIQVSELLVSATTQEEYVRGFLQVDSNLASSPPVASDELVPTSQSRTAATPLYSTVHSDEPETQQRVLQKLFKAVADGDIEMVKFHLGWTEDELDEELDIAVGPQPLCHPLCQCDKCAPLQKLTSTTPGGIHVNCTNNDGNSLLHLSIVQGYLNLVDLFCKRGGAIDAKNNAQQTPLHLACQYVRIEMAECLVRHGAKVNLKDYLGRTPLHYCAMKGADRAAHLLIKAGASVNATSTKGSTPLHEAAKLNFISLVDLLLDNGADKELRNKQNRTPRQLTTNGRIKEMFDKMEERFSRSNQHPLPVESPNNQKVIGKLVKKHSIQEIFGSMQQDNLHRLQNIAHAIQTFDRRQSLRHISVTRDRSAPQFDTQLLHQLLIQHFDLKKLRHVQSTASSMPVQPEQQSTPSSIPAQPQHLSSASEDVQYHKLTVHSETIPVVSDQPWSSSEHGQSKNVNLPPEAEMPEQVLSCSETIPEVSDQPWSSSEHGQSKNVNLPPEAEMPEQVLSCSQVGMLKQSLSSSKYSDEKEEQRAGGLTEIDGHALLCSGNRKEKELLDVSHDNLYVPFECIPNLSKEMVTELEEPGGELSVGQKFQASFNSEAKIGLTDEVSGELEDSDAIQLPSQPSFHSYLREDLQLWSCDVTLEPGIKCISVDSDTETSACYKPEVAERGYSGLSHEDSSTEPVFTADLCIGD